MDNQIISIQIFGRNLKLSCPSNEIESLKLAAKDLDTRLNELRQKTQIINNDQLIITAALNISYELTKEKRKNSQQDQELQERLKSIQKKLDML